jgi:hypothetical protein
MRLIDTGVYGACARGLGSKFGSNESGAGSKSLMKECSSTGRAPVSKTGGWGFEPLHSCQRLKVFQRALLGTG